MPRASRAGGPIRNVTLRVRIVERGVARGPSLAIGPDGAIYLVWTVGEDERADIRLARSADGAASFGAARIVEDSKGYSDAPKIAVDRAGVLHLAFAESASGPFDRYSVRYARSSDGGASIAP